MRRRNVGAVTGTANRVNRYHDLGVYLHRLDNDLEG
jgi:hypothetical protein